MKKVRGNVLPLKSIECVAAFNQVWADAIPQWIQSQLNSVLQKMGDKSVFLKSEATAIDLIMMYMRLYRTCKPLKKVFKEIVETNRQRALVILKNRAKRVVERESVGEEEVCACCGSTINVQLFCGVEEGRVGRHSVFRTCFFPTDVHSEEEMYYLLRKCEGTVCFLGRINSGGKDSTKMYCLDGSEKTKGFVLMCEHCVNIGLRQKATSPYAHYKVSDVLYNLTSKHSAIVWDAFSRWGSNKRRRSVAVNHIAGEVKHSGDKNKYHLYFWDFEEWKQLIFC